MNFVHFNGMSGEYYFNEVMGSGAALFDYDNDGDLDLYLVQGAMLGPGKTIADALVPPVGDLPPRDRLLRNDLGRDGEVRFVDVTDAVGLDASGYGMGVATGDFDNDGWVDLYVTNDGANQLWRNRGRRDEGAHQGFEEISVASGAEDPLWSTSVAVVDYDGDGWLDLYIVNYVDFRYENHRHCRGPSSRRDYCGPQNYNGEPDRLLRNRGVSEGGGLRFEDVSLASGIGREHSSGLGVVTGDFDDDGRIDFYVANDLARNQLWRNKGDGTFENEALLFGAAVNASGLAEASMGLVATDFDQDGDEDLFMTHIRGETNTLFRNEGGHFRDASSATKLAVASQAYTGFGIGVVDIENDGDMDVAVANGDVFVIGEQLLAGEPFPLRQTNQLFRNRGDGTFTEVDASLSGAAFSAFEVTRGMAVGDIDNDGDDDLVLTNNNGPARLLLNRAADGTSWLGLRLLTAGRDALGALAAVRLASGARLVRRVRTDGSYCSARDPRIRFGLTNGSAVVAIDVDWPDGSRESWSPLAVDRYHVLVQGQGEEAVASGSS